MSTLPELFRNSNSGYIEPPSKQGGIFSIKYKQPKKFSSVYQKFTESRIGTSCTTRTSYTNIKSTFQQRPYSRQSLHEEAGSYGSSKFLYAISETRPNV